MFKKYFRHNSERKPLNPIRILEWILCTLCLTLAIYVLLQLRTVHLLLKSTLILVTGAYFFITVVDITVTSLLRPLLWTSWIMFALMGALVFFLCAGLLMFQLPSFGTVLYFVILIANGMTGLVFLLEFLYMMCWLINENHSTEVNKLQTYPESEPLASATSTTSKITKTNDKINQFPEDSSKYRGNDIGVQCPSNTSLCRVKNTCLKETYAKKISPVEVPSHGGTFHVSRDVAPILSSSPLPISRCGCSRENNAFITRPKLSTGPKTLLVASQKSKDQYGNLVEEALTVKCRTVSTSARTIPKQSHETTYTVTVKDDPLSLPATQSKQSNKICNGKSVINQNTTKLCRPHSSPTQSQISILSSAAQYHYKCPSCGRTHHYSLAAQSMSNRETCSAFNSKKLPTVQECSCYEPTDEPTKDYNYYPCPSPTTPTSSNKLSPLVSTNRNGSKTSSNYPSPYFGSPCVDKSMVSLSCSDISESYSTQPSCASSTIKTKTFPDWYLNELSPSTCQSQQSSYCYTPIVSVAQKENCQKCRPNSTEAAATFGFQPVHKNEETQTQSYKVEKQDGSYCTSSKDYNRGFIKPQIYFGPDYYTNENSFTCFENNELHNWEPNRSLTATSRVQLNVIKTEEDTVLPGTVDHSPWNEISTEEYTMVHPKQQQFTVIDTNDDTSNVPVGYLIPTQCHEQKKSKTNSKANQTRLQERQRKCTII